MENSVPYLTGIVSALALLSLPGCGGDSQPPVIAPKTAERERVDPTEREPGEKDLEQDGESPADRDPTVAPLRGTGGGHDAG